MGEVIRKNFGFKPGAAWTGNRNGRPKIKCKRDKLTLEIFEKHKGDIETIAQLLINQAKDEKPWAMKMVFEYFLTRPKNNEQQEEESANDSLGSLFENIPTDQLMIIQGILNEYKKKGT
jgi:hypothetical protein